MPNEGLVLDNPVLRIEKGRISPPSEDEQEPRGAHDEHIPWGYGKDRITAMAVDPNRLYLYWELTDLAIDKARQALGSGAKDAWVSLRIYDVTGRIFDGTNAHGYFDIKVDRSDRQWFVHVGKPASTHVAEIGLKSLEGYFVKISRSSRVDFPRFEPSADGTVEWLTVRNASGPIEPALPGAPPGGPGPPPTVPSNGSADGQSAAGHFESMAEAAHGAAVELYEWSWTGWEELFQTTWQELLRTRWRDGQASLDWSTPILHSTWEAGPFAVPVEMPGVTEEFFQGPVTIIPAENGKTRIVYGPWQMVVRGLGAHAEKRVLARWEVSASWVVEMGVERVIRTLTPSHRTEQDHAGGAAILAGSSALLGASERLWLSASEIRLRGASELYFAGASELAWRGASEILVGSERRLLGASERRLLGASERRLLGASERRWLGGSEKPWSGASEHRLGGASEDAYPIEDGMSHLGRGE